VDALAHGGDETALQILDRAAEHLHHHVAAARHRIGGTQAIPWSPLGGVFQSHIFRALMTRRENADPVEAPLPPVGGGLWRAASQANWTVGQSWIDRLAASLAGQTHALAAAAPLGRI
jgi:N-acetylglucosamine kinase